MNDQRALINQSRSTISNRNIGIRVLAVDDDAAHLKIVEAMLRELHYEVVAVNHVSEAMAVLRERQEAFDIILMALNMPETDGIAILEQIEVLFKIPVVVMSFDDKEIASRCLENGASFYLKKPVTIGALSDLWQYAYLKKRKERMVIEQIGRERMVIEQIGRDLELPTPEEVLDGETESASSVNESTWRQESRRKSSKRNNQNEGAHKEDNVMQNMSMVVWTNGLHNRFLDAIDQIGLHRAAPNKILDIMNVPGLTRDSVSSRLQRYRRFLKQIMEASQSSELSVHRSLRKTLFNTSFAAGAPSSLSIEQVFSKQSGHNRCSTSQEEEDGNSIRRTKQRKLKQPLLDMILSFNQPNDDKLQIMHQKPNARVAHFSYGSVDQYNSSLLSDIQHVRSMPSSNNLNQLSSFRNTNNVLPRIQRGSTAMPSEMNQTPYYGCSLMGATQNGKGPLADTGKTPLFSTCSGFESPSIGLASSSCVMRQGLAPAVGSSGGLVTSSNPSSLILTDGNRQLPSLSPLPQRKENSIEVGEEIDRLNQLMKNNSSSGNFSSLPSFDEDDLRDILFMTVGQSPHQQETCGEVMDPEFNINTYHVENNNPSDWTPQNDTRNR